MKVRPVVPAAELETCVGDEIGISDWRPITQDMVDRFAVLTDDDQFIHVDPARAAAEAPYGGTIAHGFLTLSFLSALSEEVFPVLADTRHALNYGFDRIRFLSPVLSGSRIRGRFTLRAFEWRDARTVLQRIGVIIEIENSEKPALAADWLTLTELNHDRGAA